MSSDIDTAFANVPVHKMQDGSYLAPRIIPQPWFQWENSRIGVGIGTLFSIFTPMPIWLTASLGVLAGVSLDYLANRNASLDEYSIKPPSFFGKRMLDRGIIGFMIGLGLTAIGAEYLRWFPSVGLVSGLITGASAIVGAAIGGVSQYKEMAQDYQAAETVYETQRMSNSDVVFAPDVLALKRQAKEQRFSATPMRENSSEFQRMVEEQRIRDALAAMQSQR